MKAIIFLEDFEKLEEKHKLSFYLELEELMHKYGLSAKSVEAGHEHPAFKDGL